jgi:hypothetical protein
MYIVLCDDVLGMIPTRMWRKRHRQTMVFISQNLEKMFMRLRYYNFLHKYSCNAFFTMVFITLNADETDFILKHSKNYSNCLMYRLLIAPKIIYRTRNTILIKYALYSCCPMFSRPSKLYENCSLIAVVSCFGLL